jgi:hypothetical protein
LLAVKLVPMPKKRKTRKLRRISPASPRPEPPIRANVPKIAAEQGVANSAPTLALKPVAPAMRQIRRAWSGKYDELNSWRGQAPDGGQARLRLRLRQEGFDGQGAGQ